MTRLCGWLVTLGFASTLIGAPALPRVREAWIRKEPGHVAEAIVDDNLGHVVLLSQGDGVNHIAAYNGRGMLRASAVYPVPFANALAANSAGAIAIAGATCCYPGIARTVVYSPLLREITSQAIAVPVGSNNAAYRAAVADVVLDEQLRSFVAGVVEPYRSGEEQDAFFARFSNNSMDWIAEYWPYAEQTEGVATGIRLTRNGDVIVALTEFKYSVTHPVIARYSSSGELIWRTQLQTNRFYSSAEAIAVDSEDNVLITGAYSPSPYGNTIPLGEPYSVYIAKFTASGGLLWQRIETPEGGNNGASALAVGSDDSLYVTGSGWTGKVSSNGELVWSNEATGASISADSFGNTYICRSVTSFRGDTDIETVKFDRFGAQIWKKVFNGAGNSIDQFRGMVLKDRDGLYVTGSSSTEAGSDLLLIKYIEVGRGASLRRRR